MSLGMVSCIAVGIVEGCLKWETCGLRSLSCYLQCAVGSEICDRFAAVGFHANMITYLTQQLNMPLVKASNTLTNFGGTSSFTPLIGALIADSFAGQFWTIAVGSLFYELGFIAITISAIIPKLHPPPCPTQVNCQEASTLQLSVLYLAFLLTSIGTGGIRPCQVQPPKHASTRDLGQARTSQELQSFFSCQP